MDARTGKMMELFRARGLASPPAGSSAGSSIAYGLGSRGVPAPMAAAPATAVDLVAHPGQSIADAYDYYMGKKKMPLHGEMSPAGREPVDDPDYPLNPNLK